MENNTNAIYIKYVNANTTEEFIKETFASSQFGSVSSIKFIPKQNEKGEQYNGTIVYFNYINQNDIVKFYFNKMNSSQDGTTRFNYCKQRYWIIKIHEPKHFDLEQNVSNFTPVNTDITLTEQDRIQQLEMMLQSMMSENYYLKAQQQQNLKKIQEFDIENTYQHLQIVELKSQLEEQNKKIKEVEDINENLELKNSKLAFSIELINTELESKEDECLILQEEIRDEISTRHYVEEQVEDLVALIKLVKENDPVKMRINKYIQDYIR
jgi:hypothetical protein